MMDWKLEGADEEEAMVRSPLENQRTGFAMEREWKKTWRTGLGAVVFA
jgi:hypothetical protein